MSDELQQQEEDAPDDIPELPPVLPGEELDDLEGEEVGLDAYAGIGGEDDVESDTDTTARRRSSAPAKKRKRAPSPELLQRQVVGRAMDVNDWLDAIEHKYGSFEQPGVKVQLERLSPQYQNGLIVGGLLDQWESRKPDLPNIIDEWGGGSFRLKVQIHKRGAPPRNLAKVFDIGAMPPKTRSSNVPQELGGGMPNAYAPPHPNANQPVHPLVEKRALDLVGEQLAFDRKNPQRSGVDIELLKQYEGTYRATTEQVVASAEARAREREVSAGYQVAQAEARMNEARQAMEVARREAERVQNETTEKIHRATAESQGMLGTLLPIFSENASRQVDSVTQTFMAREARIETGHAKEVDSLYRQHETEMRNSQAQHQAEMTRLETVYSGQLQMLQIQIQQLQMQLEGERRDNNTIRNDIAQLRTEQVTNLLKQSDPVEKLQQLSSLRDIVGEILPGVSGEAGDLSDSAPDWMKMINSVAGSLGPAIGQIIEARTQQQQTQQPQQYTPQQLAWLQQQAMLQASQQHQQQGMLPYAGVTTSPTPTARAGTPEAKAAPQVAFNRLDLEHAVEILTSIYTSGTPAADAASAATKHLPHDMLRELARRTPAKVIDQLEAAGILTPQLLTDEGRQYVTSFLVASRALL